MKYDRYDTNVAINRLMRGIASDHVETTRDAWRDLLNAGAAAVPIILDKLSSSAWGDYPRGPLVKYLGVLLSLLDDLDRAAFRQEIDRLLTGRLHPYHRKTVEMLARRVRDEPALHIGPDIPVYLADDIAQRSVVIDNLQRWSRTHGLDLENVSRIDVIASGPQLDYLGRYNLFFSGIILTWPSERLRGLRLWWWRLTAEFTFYHEVGHHACGHIEFGQVAEQEEEANDYARSMMRRSRPVFTAIGLVILVPLKPLLRLIVSKAKHVSGASGTE